MIQRIQTVYLLVITVLTGLMFALPLASFMGDGQTVSLFAGSIKDADAVQIVSTSYYMALLIAMATFLPFETIFLFKRRMVQIRLCLVEIVLQVGVLAYLVYYILHIRSSVFAYADHSMSLELSSIFPIVSIILSLLAYRAVVKDEALVNSLNRIR